MSSASSGGRASPRARVEGGSRGGSACASTRPRRSLILPPPVIAQFVSPGVTYPKTRPRGYLFPPGWGGFALFRLYRHRGRIRGGRQGAEDADTGDHQNSENLLGGD